MVVGESRTELLQWLNLTLGLNYTKVENCGTGAAYCQLMDCIVGGVPMSKVNFKAQTEYDYLQNFKILQASFNKNRITKSIDVERLVKCRLQDNLELLQWFKKFWHENKDIKLAYDPVSRRRSLSQQSGGSSTPITMSKTRTSSGQNNQRSASSNSRLSSISSNGRTSIPPSTPTNSRITQLTKQLSEVTQDLANANDEILEYRILVDSLETERNFYFNKLREIELMIENINQLNEDEIKSMENFEFLKKVQAILYSTEEGFQSNENVDYDNDSF